MPLLNAVTTPYAEAFLQVVDSSNETEEIIPQVKSIIQLLNDSVQLQEALSSPVLENEAKKSIIEKLFADDINPSFLNLLKLLADRQRIGLLGAVLERFLELYREKRNIALATVTSATPLTEDQETSLKLKISKIAGTENLELNCKIDESLIGGFIVRVGSKVVDASLAGQVRKLGLLLSK
tara:strand:- start:22111 stop:22653 length:543 start_codon:yes stop_codon:yes gene_type:complete